MNNILKLIKQKEIAISIIGEPKNKKDKLIIKYINEKFLKLCQ